jgi:hypothetical protein
MNKKDMTVNEIKTIERQQERWEVKYCERMGKHRESENYGVYIGSIKVV